MESPRAPRPTHRVLSGPLDPTRSLGDEHGQLATFVHEQFHWWVADRDDDRDAAIAEFQAIFPDVPAQEVGGARDDRSTYQHLIVNDLEYQAMTEMIGEAGAREIMASYGHYQWIYGTLLEDPRVREINLRHGFNASAVDR